MEWRVSANVLSVGDRPRRKQHRDQPFVGPRPRLIGATISGARHDRRVQRNPVTLVLTIRIHRLEPGAYRVGVRPSRQQL